MGAWQLHTMARPKRSRKLSGSQFADPFILPKGRSVIKGFDADDGDFIGVPSDAKFKLLKRKGGVLIKGKGFRSMVKGATVAEVEDSLENVLTLEGWDTTGDVTVSKVGTYLTFDGKGEVRAPKSMYEGWEQIQIRGAVSFPGEGMLLDDGNTAVYVLHYDELGDIKIDGGGGKDVIHFGPPISATSEGSIEPKNIEVLRLDNGSQRWSIDGEHPDMSVEIYDGGVEISEDTRLNKITAVWSQALMDRDDDDPFVTVKDGSIINFNEVFTNPREKLVLDPAREDLFPTLDSDDDYDNVYLLLDGAYEEATAATLTSKEGFERYSGFGTTALAFYTELKGLDNYVTLPSSSLYTSNGQADVDLPFGGIDLVVQAHLNEQ